MIPNLAVDHVASTVPLVRLADVRSAILARPYAYWIAAVKIGLSPGEYAAFVRHVQADDATYTVLPRHIDAMSARHRDGRIYVLRHVVVPTGTAGWIVPLDDGTLIMVPTQCGNLSANRGKRIGRSHTFVPLNVPYRGYYQPVVFTPPAPIISAAPVRFEPAALPITSAPEAPSAQSFRFGWLAPLFAPLVDWIGGGNNTKPCPVFGQSCETGVYQK